MWGIGWLLLLCLLMFATPLRMDDRRELLSNTPICSHINSKYLPPRVPRLHCVDVRQGAAGAACNAVDTWTQPASSTPTDRGPLVVLSYGHNGFGNQLYQHTIAYLVANALKASFFFDTIDESMAWGKVPPNTNTGAATMDQVMPEAFKYYSLSATDTARQTCEGESFFITDRPRDLRELNYTSVAKNLASVLNDPSRPRCLKFIGYWNNYPLCYHAVRALWQPLIRSIVNSSLASTFHPQDLSIYLRCVPNHYHFSPVSYYENIMTHTTVNKVWLFLDPWCSGYMKRIGSLPATVIRYLTKTWNATIWQHDEDGGGGHLTDFEGLLNSPRLVIPAGSTWGFWAGLFSSAAEVHVNMDYHPVMGRSLPQYVYHQEGEGRYYGQYKDGQGAGESIVFRFQAHHPTGV